MKFAGIWWGMHLNVETWGSGPRHGATTANTRRYIDFAATHGFGGVLVEEPGEGGIVVRARLDAEGRSRLRAFQVDPPVAEDHLD